MAVFRVQKNQNYTVMSNYHLSDKRISLKAKGLLSQILSLPDIWNYTLRGLAHINKESIDAIRTAILELEKHGYITRRRERNADGSFGGSEYIIYERPQCEQPASVPPALEKPMEEVSALEEATQLNTYVEKKQEENTKSETIHPSIAKPDSMDAMEIYRDLVKDNIEYDAMVERYGSERMDEVVAVMLDAVCHNGSFIRIGGGHYPPEVVKSRLLSLNSSHIEYVFSCLDENTTKIHNIRGYLLTSLYNAPTTLSAYYQAEVNHDLYRDRG